ncbi:MAG: cyanophycinase [Balneolaceae bacterium]
MQQHEYFTNNNGHLETPKGFLVAVGGNEDKDQDLSVLQKMVSLLDKKELAIEVITTASSIPEQVGAMYERPFAKIGNNKMQAMHIKSRGECEKEEYIERIKAADIIFFSGGDQLRLSYIFRGTQLLDTIVDKYHNEKCIIAGTSAGAAAMSKTMIYEGRSSEAFLKGGVKITAGIGFLSNVIVDSHFITRSRFARLMQAVTSNPGHIGIGLGEDTGIIIRDGNLIETIGSGLVVVFGGSEIRHTNLDEIENGEPLVVENLQVHTLSSGYGYDIHEEKFLLPSELEQRLITEVLE